MRATRTAHLPSLGLSRGCWAVATLPLLWGTQVEAVGVAINFMLLEEK